MSRPGHKTFNRGAVNSSHSNFQVNYLKVIKKRSKRKLISRKAIFFAKQFRRAICSPPTAFEESLEGSKSYGSPQMAKTLMSKDELKDSHYLATEGRL